MVRIGIICFALLAVPLAGCQTISDTFTFSDQADAEHDSSKYNWPFKDAPEYLEKGEDGQVFDVADVSGNPATLTFETSYTSAAHKKCKQYFVNLDAYLACFNPHWYPVRYFEE